MEKVYLLDIQFLIKINRIQKKITRFTYND